MPITWKNVESRDDRASANLMAGAQKSMTAGVETFNNMFDEMRETKKEDFEIIGERNEDAYLDKLQSFRTADELTAGQGELDAMLGSFNGNVDRDKIRGASDKQLDYLHGRSAANNLRLDKEYERLARPILDEAAAMRANPNNTLEDQQAWIKADPNRETVLRQAGKWGEFNELGATDRAGDKKTNRDEFLYTSNNKLGSLINDSAQFASANADATEDDAVARGLAEARIALANGEISEEDFGKVAPGIHAAYTANFTPGAESMRRLERAAEKQTNLTASKNTVLQQKFDNTVRGLKLPPDWSGDMNTIAKASEIAKVNGFDGDNGDTIIEDGLKVAKLRLTVDNKGIEWTPQRDAILEHISALAVQQMHDDGNMLENDDLNQTAFENAVVRIFNATERQQKDLLLKDELEIKLGTDIAANNAEADAVNEANFLETHARARKGFKQDEFEGRVQSEKDQKALEKQQAEDVKIAKIEAAAAKATKDTLTQQASEDARTQSVADAEERLREIQRQRAIRLSGNRPADERTE